MGRKDGRDVEGDAFSVKPELLEPVYIRGPAQKPCVIERLAEDIAKKHREIGILTDPPFAGRYSWIFWYTR